MPKVYKQSLKFEHSGELNWMEPALMKPYSDAGLSALAKVRTLCTSGYPLASIKSCTQFKQTHRFLLEAWEAVYWVMLTKFLAYFAPDDKKGDQSITEFITQTILSIQSQSHEDFWKSYIRTTCWNENLVEKILSTIPIIHSITSHSQSHWESRGGPGKRFYAQNFSN